MSDEEELKKRAASICFTICLELCGFIEVVKKVALLRFEGRLALE